MKSAIILLGLMINTQSCSVGSGPLTVPRELEVAATLAEGSVRRRYVAAPTKDARIYAGRYILAADGPEFRACNLDEKYLVDASFSVEETLDYFIQSQPMIQAQVYIRFHGEVIEGIDGLPDHYANVVRITELLAYSAAVPTPCE